MDNAKDYIVRWLGHHHHNRPRTSPR